ncbi:MAG TPA: DJ-1/PfpI family protein [Pseudomonadales bacterium]|nr:DJ-1/PfpI family protein [Pseudomonadales bacterium]
MQITVLIYPGMTALDAMGPLQAWSMWPGAEVQTVWKTQEPLATDSAAVFVPTTDFAGAFQRPDILCVPGGTAATFALLEDQEVLDFLREKAAHGGWVTSVCTGALVLGAAGLLEGRRATTHWLALDQLAKFGAEVVRERWVIDGKVATGGGVTAGIDFALALMAHIDGDDVARTVQLAMEYAPAPPFACGTPEAAGPELAGRVAELFAAQMRSG